MKLHLLFTVFAVVVIRYSLTAQPVPPQTIEDSVIGWMKVYHFKGVNTSTKVDDKTYSANQISLCDSFANWIQASYIPTGGLGDVKKSVSEKLGLYNQYTAGKPQSYGAYAKTYFELKYNSSRKLEPFTNSHIWWSIMANGIPGDWPVRGICTPTQYYFTLPNAETEVEDESVKKILDLTGNENTRPYISFWVPNMGYGGGRSNVVLCRNNKSPFIKVTKGEYLKVLETALQVFYESERKKIYEQNKGNQKGIDYFMKYLDDKNMRRTACLNSTKEKYKNRLGESADMFTSQPDLLLENIPDVFEGNENHIKKFPVYKVDPALAELCKTDNPQWILISWENYPGTRIEKQQHESIINNFNFGYVYNFFFEQGKIKGQPYKPLRSPYFREATALTEASAATQKNSTDSHVAFFEDFSATGAGKKPLGWRAESANAENIVTSLDGLDGKWMVIAGDFITSTSIKKPLPQNFTLSYDLVASQGFKWGGYGCTFKLSKETSPGNAESYLKLKLRPGFDGKDGEATLETKFPVQAEYSNTTKWYAAAGFSNNKKINRVSITLKKTADKLVVFINNTKLAEFEKAIPPALLFNALSLDGGTRDNDKFYISNIKITND